MNNDVFDLITEFASSVSLSGSMNDFSAMLQLKDNSKNSLEQFVRLADEQYDR